LARLNAARLSSYDRTRNRLDGDVTGLSPYLRHGALTLAEVRDHALRQSAPLKFVQELAWRDYYQRVYAEIGDGIWVDREPYKTGFTARDYADDLPADIRQGSTGTVMDLFIADLLETGYVHNHARMYLAAYVVHWRRVKWQAGARWFLEHLLDGDPASNNLSWQWVASTFSQKPYFFNADNLRKYAGSRARALSRLSWEPFEGSYEELEKKLFRLQGTRR
jgi:deoxyribodipyrimidine photo-lyase